MKMPSGKRAEHDAHAGVRVVDDAGRELDDFDQAPDETQTVFDIAGGAVVGSTEMIHLMQCAEVDFT
ncbi:hypothetical protein [Ornithinimicrobium faecis]|uniref:hypothetical protein n=1 Tax=Ornithinimicrobium faecis TaxID=2934158 RepID=UPI002118520B|nr:hypothetical protein [Ornithinimicrobium sp. HY1745]